MTPREVDQRQVAMPIGDVEYHDAVATSVITAAFILAMAALTIIAAMFGLETASPLEAIALKIGAGFAAIAFPLGAVKAMLRPWGIPRLRIDDQGVHIAVRGLLSGMVPGLKPKVEHIPWAKIEWIDEGPGPIASVVIDYEGFKRSKVLALLRTGHADFDGRVISLHGLTTSGPEIRDRLMRCQVEYGLLEKARADLLDPFNQGPPIVRTDAE